MKKKTLQAIVIALGVLSSSFMVSAMGKTSVESSPISEMTEESPEEVIVEGEQETLPEENLEEDSILPPTEGNEGTDSKKEFGWISDASGWQYKDENGNLVKDGWREIEGKRYYFDKLGYMATYWQYIDEEYYWFGTDGAMKKGWEEIRGKWYYLGGNGVMQTGWIEPGDGHWYYAYADGAIQTGWFLAENERWYYANANGVMQTGWIELGDGNWYYTYEDGAMQTGWFAPGDGHWYYANANGVMQTGWFLAENERWYYANAHGAMQTGWIEPGDGNWYYAYADGAMQTGWFAPGDGHWYYANTNGVMQTGWICTGNDMWYYAYKNGTVAINTWEKMKGSWYWFDESGLMAQGWKYIGRYKYYFAQSGYMLQDLDGILGRQSSYEITVNRKKCQVMVYAKDGSNGYIIPVKTLTCSVGLPSTPTPTGTFYTPDKYRWHTLMGPSYGQYCTRISGGILFHSVAGYNMTSYNIHARDYNKLGSPASHGCVRLNVRDAKWIYDNCRLGTKVTISDYVATPFDKPATIKIPASQNWDPTDPNI